MRLIETILAISLLTSCFGGGGGGGGGGALSPTSGGFSGHKEVDNVISIDLPANGIYTQGQTLYFTASHPSVVTVSGSPRISLDIGGSTVYAPYVSGSGSKQLTFTYTVQAGDTDSNGISVSDNIDLNSGAITFNNGESDIDVDTTFSGGTLSGVLIDTTAPSTTIATTPPNKTYYEGQALTFTVAFDETVYVSGTPNLSLNIGGVSRSANYFTGNGTSSLFFRYNIVLADLDLDGIALAGTIQLAGGLITDLAGNNAGLTFVAAPTVGILVDGDAPYVETITYPANDLYLLGTNLDYRLRFSENVTITNTPQLAIDIGGVTRYADYLAGSGTRNIDFRYTIQDGDEDTNGVLLGSSINLPPGALIQDSGLTNAATDISPNLTPNVRVNGLVPRVASITPPADDNYVDTEVITFVMTFDDVVYVTGTPTIQLLIDSSSPVVSLGTYISGSGTTDLTFSYTVQASDSDTNGIQLLSPMNTNGGSIQNALGTDADLDISTLLGALTLSNVKIASSGPSIAITSPTNGSYINAANDSTTFALSGTCSEAGQTVSVELNSVAAVSPAGFVCNGTTFSGTIDTTALAEGAYAIEASITDISLVTATSTAVNVTKDTIAPTIALTTPAHNGYINIASNSTTSTVSGTCSESGQIVNIQIDSVDASSQLGLGCNGTNFSGSFDSTALGETSFSFTAIISDAAGNSTTSSINTVTKDVTSPTVAITSSPNINVLNHTAYTYSGTCSENGEDVDLLLGGTDSYTVTCSSGTWNSGSLDVSALGDSPTFALAADHPDLAGNPANAATTVDKSTSNPAVAITSAPDISVANQTTYTVSGTCTDNTFDVDVMIGTLSYTPVCTGGAWTTGAVDVSSLVDGPVTITADHDNGVTSATQASTSVTKDTEPPTIAISTPATASYINNGNVSTSFTVFGTCSEFGEIVNIQIDAVDASSQLGFGCNGTNFSGTIDATVLSDGPLSFTAIISDTIGNSTTSAAIAVTKDTSNPTVAITYSPDINSINQGNYSFTGSCSESGRDVDLLVGGVDSYTVSCIGGGWTSGSVDVSGLADSATFALAADHTDLAGNSAIQATTTVDKTTSVPTVSITSAPDINQANETDYTVSGTCSENGFDVDVMIGTLSYTPLCSGGAWTTSAQDVSSLADGPVSITADHDDGVTSATQASTTVTKDTTSDLVTLTSAPNITGANETSYIVSGTCSNNGVTVTVDVGTLSFTPTCTSGTFSTGPQDVSSLGDGSVLVTADHATATQASTTVSKSTSTPIATSLGVAQELITEIDLTWSLSDPGGYTIDDYTINYRVQGSPSWLTFSDGVSTTTSATVTGLTASTTYEFRVRVEYNSGSSSDWTSTVEGETKPNNPLFSANKAMNVGGATQSRVVAYEDTTAITLNGSPLVTLNKGQVHDFTSSQFDVIDADKPIFTAGKRGSGSGASIANIVWQPTAWAGKTFSFNATRSNPQVVEVYAVEATTVTVKQGTTTLDSATVAAGASTSLSWSTYGSYQVSSTGLILAYHYSNASSNYTDPKPLLPTATEIIGYPSNSMRLTVDQDGTNYYGRHSNSTNTSGSMNKSDVTQINPQGGTTSLYRSDSLLISADKPISGASFADSNGLCAAPFLPTALMKTKYAINVNSDYVAFASKASGSITVYDSSDTVITTLNLTRTGGDTNAPYKAYMTNPLNGYRFYSTVPMAGWYQPNTSTGGSADQDESILYGTD